MRKPSFLRGGKIMNKFKAPRSLADLQKLLNILETTEDLQVYREHATAITPFG